MRFRLAGSGWYETDFKSDKEAKRNLHEKADKDEAKTDGSGGSEAGTKSEAKDAAKPGREGRSREERFREERFREERLFRADRKRQAQPRQPAGHDFCAIEVERTDEARAHARQRCAGAGAEELV